MSTARKFTDGEESLIYENYRQSRSTIGELAAIYSVCDKTIYNVIQRVGELKPRKRFTDEQALIMWQRYTYSQDSIAAIAIAYDAPESTIYGAIRRVGSIRPRAIASAIKATVPNVTPKAVANRLQRECQREYRYAGQFGSALRKWRHERRFTQQDISQIMGIEVGRYGKYERGTQIPNFKTIMRMAAALQVCPSRLFEQVIIEY